MEILRSEVVKSIRDVWGDMSDLVFNLNRLEYAEINGVTLDIVDDTSNTKEMEEQNDVRC